MTSFLLVLAAQVGQMPDISPVHRCAFEDRSRMVLVQQSPNRWMAFNPKTCAIQKIWEGEVEWRGKVFDFSQDNSRSKGKTLFELPSTIWQQASDWTGKGTKLEAGGISFAEDGANIETSPMNVVAYKNIFVAFDETSRAAPFRVEVIDPTGKTGDWFDSTKHGHSDTDWQWNFKQVWPDTVIAKIRWTSAKAASKKKLRNARVFGDYQMFTAVEAFDTRWKGYRVEGNGVTLMFDLLIGSRVINGTMRVGPDQYTLTFTGNLKGAALRLPPGFGLEVADVPATEVYPLSTNMVLRLKEVAR